MAVIFFFTVLAAVNGFLRVCQDKHLIQSLLDRCDAARIFTLDDIADFLWKTDALLVDDFSILNDIDGHVRIDEADNGEIQLVNRALYLENVLVSHLLALCVDDHRDRAVKLVKLQIVIDLQSLAGADVVEYESLFNSTYVQHDQSPPSFIALVSSSPSSRSVYISAMRIYMPQ